MEAVSARDVWAIGFSYEENSSGRALTLHWNGRRWKVVSDASGEARGSVLSAVASIPGTRPGQLWAVGYHDVGDDWPFEMLALLWRGRGWRAAPTRMDYTYFNLEGVSAVSPSNAWAAGWIFGDGEGDAAVVIRWNGRAWEKHFVSWLDRPAGLRDGAYLNDVVALSPSNVWAVGSNYYWEGGAGTLTQHWDGLRWRIVSSPNPTPVRPDTVDRNVLEAVTRAPGTKQVWAVGWYQPQLGPRRTLVERYC